MPIPVICPGCKASFRVSDQFAGKTGPCPKCKTPIKIPELPKEQIVIHEPDKAGPKDAKGRLISKPIPRRSNRLSTRTWIVVGFASLIAFALAWMLGGYSPSDFQPLKNSALAQILLLLIVSGPIVWLGYQIPRSDDMDSFQGRALLTRTALCALSYVALWAAFRLGQTYFPPDLMQEAWPWICLFAPFLLIGALAGLGFFDLEFAGGAFHFVFYVALTGLLLLTAGVPLVPPEPAATQPSPPSTTPAATPATPTTHRESLTPKRPWRYA